MEYQSFKEFYPFYLSQHQNGVCRTLHYIGTICLLSLLVFAIVKEMYALIALTPLVGYGFAWVGHFVFEKNRPATFKYPLYSLMGDFIMFYELTTGKLSFFPEGQTRS